jgi:predicted Fe-Mo cluster-binding NifX family protein
MKLCLPTVNEQGLTGRLSPHFGSAPFFTVVDTETNAVEVVSNGHAQHEHGTCMPTAALAARDVDAVACRGLGRHAFAALEASGIAVYWTEEWGVAGALEAFRAGRLARMVSEQVCHGGRHDA